MLELTQESRSALPDRCMSFDSIHSASRTQSLAPNSRIASLKS